MSFCPPVVLLSYPHVILSYRPPVPLSSCTPVLMSFCPPVLLSTCPPVHLYSCPPVLLSSCPPVPVLLSPASFPPSFWAVAQQSPQAPHTVSCQPYSCSGQIGAVVTVIKWPACVNWRFLTQSNVEIFFIQ